MENETRKRILLTTGLVALAFWATNLLIGLISLCSEKGWANELGDSFGMVNALFSSATLAYVVFAGQQQQKSSAVIECLQDEQVKSASMSAYAQCLAALVDNLTARTLSAQARFDKLDETLRIYDSKSQNLDDFEELKKDRTKAGSLLENLAEQSRNTATDLVIVMTALRSNSYVAATIKRYEIDTSDESN
jgi:hypothetical protein